MLLYWSIPFDCLQNSVYSFPLADIKGKKWALNAELLRVWVRYYLTHRLSWNTTFLITQLHSIIQNADQTHSCSHHSLPWMGTPLALSVHVGYWSCFFFLPYFITSLLLIISLYTRTKVPSGKECLTVLHCCPQCLELTR